MNAVRIIELISVYRDGLLQDTLPFWLKHCVDREYGGFITSLDRDGTVIDTDKGMWQQCRFTWLLATLYNTIEKRDEWRQLAQHGIDFIRKYGFDQDGRMFFHLTREGKPVRKRRYVFTEAFAAMALAAYSRTTGDDQAARQAKDLMDIFLRYSTTEGLIPPKINPQTRSCKGLAPLMMIIVAAQELRENLGITTYDHWIDRAIDEIERDFMKPEFETVMETVGPQGELIDHFDGRMLNPGHAIEAGWFIMHEASHRNNDARLIKLGTTILDWMWQRGWDEEFGGILYFRDVKNLPVQEYWQDMKFWWPQNETIIATLLAYKLTGDEKYARWHQMIHDWAYKHFPDPQYGEWFGYLHRDGRISVPLKGNLWKGPFHLPRMQWYCWQLLEKMK